MSAHEFYNDLNVFPDPAVVFDGRGRVLALNDLAFEFFGKDTLSLDDCLLSDFVGTKMAARWMETSVEKDPEKRRTVVSAQKVDGSVTYAEASVSRLQSLSDLRFISFLKELPHFESERTLREELSTKVNTYYETLVHFHRVIPNDILIPASQLDHDCRQFQSKIEAALDETGKDYCQFAVSSATRIRKQVLDLQEYFELMKERSVYKESLTVSDIFESSTLALQEKIKEKNAVVELRTDKDTVVVGNRSLLSKALENLIDNALKFCNDKPSIVVTATRSNSDLSISVEDNGIGIEQRHFDRIFVLFQRLHLIEEYEGTGTGLAVVKKIAELHNADVEVASKVGAGSRFTLVF